MDEQEIIRHLLTLPRELREHLVTVYGDAASLFSELLEGATTPEIINQMKQQQAAYVRIAKALKDTLDG